ncbi:MAG: leucine-rich repeat protein [Clostridia bacterium]|nr:leucine-rich repeat protein [Clostridia bacterium]
MAVFKCKMCGESLLLEDVLGAQKGICKCHICNTVQTISISPTEKVEGLFGSANHHRRINEYDVAMAIYQQILTENSQDSEAYWGIVLCRYGIEYVKDPRTGVMLPTINRTQLKSVTADDDYKLALEYATEEQRELYEKEATVIDNIQKGIWEISKKEEPFDVFICYKETDSNGDQTEDSVLAYDLYRELTRDGIKVFYAKVTLESKLGSAYEPYIFSALNSAPVMIALGTKKEYFNAVWVKNEWSRYINMINQGKRKTLIPAYKDMSPYDMPWEFSAFQGQDLGAIGGKLNLIRAVERILDKEPEKKEEAQTQKTGVMPTTMVVDKSVEGQLSRAYALLAEGRFDYTTDLVNKMLKENFDNAEAYLIKFLAEYKLTSKEAFAKSKINYKQNQSFQMARRYAGEELLAEINRLEKQYAYNEAEGFLNQKDFETALTKFDLLASFSDAPKRVDECKQGIYDKALKAMNNKGYGVAITEFQKISDFKDATQKIEECKTGKLQLKYDSAMSYMADGDYMKAIGVFEELNGFKDSKEKIDECSLAFKQLEYDKAIALMNSKEYKKAKSIFEKLGKHNDSESKIAECDDCLYGATYNKALSLIEKKEYVNAIHALIPIPKHYKETSAKIDSCYELQYNIAKDYKAKKNYKKAIELFKQIDGHLDSRQQITECERLEEKAKKFRIIRNTVLVSLSLALMIFTIIYLVQLYHKTDEYIYVVNDVEGVVEIVDVRENSSIENYIIPEEIDGKKIVSIGNNAFMKCKTIKSVTIPNGVTSIGEYAFQDCSSLASISIPDSVTNIGAYAFDGCESLKNISIPNSVTSIGGYAFRGCRYLSSVVIPKSVVSMGYSVFYNCVESIDIYCEATSKPEGWNEEWHYADRILLTDVYFESITWGYTGE